MVRQTDGRGMRLRASAVGALVGAALGGISRGALAVLHAHELTQTTFLAVLTVAVIGIVVGGLSGMIGRPLLGALVGAALSALVYFATLPVALFMQAIQIGSTASLAEVLAVGALVGAIAGVVAERVYGRRSRGRGAA